MSTTSKHLPQRNGASPVIGRSSQASEPSVVGGPDHGPRQDVIGGPDHGPRQELMGGPDHGPHQNVIGGPDEHPRQDLMGGPDRGPRQDVMGSPDPRSAVRERSPRLQPQEGSTIMSRFISWLAIGVAAAFLVVASASFSLGAVQWLAFSVAIGTLVVSAGIAYYDRASGPVRYVAVPILVISAWTIVASLVFSLPTVQHLALASSLAISGFALVGLTANELSQAHAVQPAKDTSNERESRLATAA